jgi:CBS domain-containing protein
VINYNGQVIGLISKNFLLILIKEKMFYGEKNLKNFYMSKGRLIKKNISEKVLTNSTHVSSSQRNLKNYKPKNLIDVENVTDSDYGGDDVDFPHHQDHNNSKLPIINKTPHETSVFVVNKKFDLTSYYEYNSFPDAKEGLSWLKFTTPFVGKDYLTNQKIKEQCHADQNKLIDLRPYMVENPETITKFDFLPKILRRFQHQHLRHLIVVNPITGLLEGMITRQDIFEWLPL